MVSYLTEYTRASLRGEAYYRLTGSSAFTRIFERGRRHKGQFVHLIFHSVIKEEGAMPIRYGIVVGRKTLKRAVDRNRFKRKVREVFRVWRDEFFGCEILVCARHIKRETINAATAEVEHLLKSALAAKNVNVAPA